MDKKLEDKISTLFKSVKAIFLNSKELYHGKFINLIEEDYLLPNGKKLKRERIIKNKHKEAVIIITITNNNEYILVAQNRIDNKASLEFPSGYIEDNETWKEAAIRELREETGYVPLLVQHLDSYYSQLGIDSSINHIVIARGCIKEFNQKLSPNEYLNYDLFRFKDLTKLIENNIINSVGNKLAYYRLLAKKDSNFL